MTIRPATILDSNAILTLLDHLGYPGRDDAFVKEKIERHAHGNYCVLVAVADEEITGFVSMHWFDMFHSSSYMGRITAVCVREDLRAKGTGKGLVDAAEQYLFSKGCSHAEVTCNLRRTLTHDFYRKNGYREDSKRFIKTLAPENSAASPPLAQ